ncbi:MAG: NADH-quinone oxidoreductase subunit H [Caldisericaceae bacterium]
MVEKIVLVLTPVLAFFVGIFLVGFKRKMVARIHRRYGPPLHQPLLDIIKLLAKKENISHGVMFDLGPVIALGASILTVLFLPLPGFKLLTPYGDLIAFLYIMVIGSLGMALGAGESGNPNASIGIARALTLMLGYDLPFIIAGNTLILKYGTTSLFNLMNAQSNLHWNLFFLPLTAVAGFIATYGAMGEHPFDVVVAPQEVATGPMVEYGGKHLGMLMIDHAMHVYIETALFVTLFLGGASNIWIFILKQLGVVIVMTLVDTVLPRFRIENAVRYFWRWPTIFALLGLFIVYLGG